jgi:hypothetical protein
MQKMKSRLIILTILSIVSTTVFGQIKTVGPIDFSCNGQLFSIDYGVWIDPIQSCDKFNYDFYSNTVNFKDIPSTDSLVIEKIKFSLKERGGQDFYSRLILQSVIISKRPKKCEGRKYTLRYIFPLDTIFYHRFSLTYDIDGNLLSDHKFPDYATNKNILTFINYCQAIELAISDTTFNKAYNHPGHVRSRKDEKTGEWIKIGDLPKMELGYDKGSNVWTWALYTETVFDGEKGDQRCVTGTWTGKKITINAQDSTIMKVEDYKEFKTVTNGW